MRGWLRRRRFRRWTWELLREGGFEVVPRRKVGSSGPILTAKGRRQARLHGIARKRPRGQG